LGFLLQHFLELLGERQQLLNLFLFHFLHASRSRDSSVNPFAAEYQRRAKRLQRIARLEAREAAHTIQNFKFEILNFKFKPGLTNTTSKTTWAMCD
jgi:hypothetical protein